MRRRKIALWVLGPLFLVALTSAGCSSDASGPAPLGDTRVSKLDQGALVRRDRGTLTLPDRGTVRSDALLRDKSLGGPDQRLTGCDPKCTAVDPTLCVPNPADPTDCVECTTTSQCQTNPGAFGPKCDTTQNYCICENDGDCANSRHGVRCDPTERYCFCQSSADCKTAPYTACDDTGECVTPP